MLFSPADLRLVLDRTTSLLHRGLASLRTRGLGPTWRRLLRQFHPVRTAPLPYAPYHPAAGRFEPFSLPCSERPQISIVIPVFNGFGHTLACLRALAEHPPLIPFEVIVADDGSSDATVEAMSDIAGVRYLRREENAGFIAACNEGAAIARGRHLVFLNNDTIPQPGWLEALLHTFELHPKAGIVGALLLYPDGRLQEAGAIVYRDGSADKLGRHQPLSHPAHGYVRTVDYCSGAAIALPRSLFEAAGGFDRHYQPAFYEDTDLGMRVRALGWEVLCQPAARVLHVEGATAGTDVRQGVKAYQARNRHLFRDRWQAALASHPVHATPASRLTDHRHAHCVLIVDARTPRPDRDSGSLRLANLMRLLREEGAHVVFLPTDRSHAGPYTEALQQFGVETWYAPFVRRIPAWLQEHGPRFDCVIACRHHVMAEVLPLLRRHAPQARVVLDTVDLHYLRERRGAELADDPALLRASERTRSRELGLIARCDATLVVSEVERAQLAADAPGARVEVLSNLHRAHGSGLPFERRRDVIFVGGFQHPPNSDAVRWFVGQVWPRIQEQAPELVFHCIGADVPADIAALARHPGVRIHGHVPDLEPYMAGARVAVAPLRYGAGVKGKINLSMAHGQPVVATSCAVEGMHLHHGEDVLVADDPRGFADAVVRLHSDAALWTRLSGNGHANVARHFSFDAARIVVRDVLLGSQSNARPA